MRLLTVVVLLCVVTSAQAFVKIGEFVSPIQSDPNIVGYFLAYGDDYNPKSPNDVHGGVDWKTDVGTKVYSIADGEVVLVSYNGWTKDTGWRNFGLVIRYKINGKVFYVVYGHLACPPSYIDETLPMTLKELQSQWLHQRVKAGDVLGTIGKWGSMPHLHFGIYYSDEMPTNKLGIQQMPIPFPVVIDGLKCYYGGWTDPINFLEATDVSSSNNIVGPILASTTGSGQFYFVVFNNGTYELRKLTLFKTKSVGNLPADHEPIELVSGQADSMILTSKVGKNYVVEILTLDGKITLNKIYESSTYVRMFPFDGKHANPMLTFSGYKGYDYKTGKVEDPKIAMREPKTSGVMSFLFGPPEMFWCLYYDTIFGDKRTIAIDVVGENGPTSRTVFNHLEFEAFGPVSLEPKDESDPGASIRIAFSYKDSDNMHIYSAILYPKKDDAVANGYGIKKLQRLCASNGSDRILARLPSSLIIRSDLNGKSDLYTYDIASGDVGRITRYNTGLTFSK